MSRDRRQNFRVELTAPATLELPNRTAPLPCTIVNLSNGGARIAGVKGASLPDEFSIRIGTGRNALRACRVAWRLPDEVGVAFIDGKSDEGAPSPRRKAEPVE